MESKIYSRFARLVLFITILLTQQTSLFADTVTAPNQCLPTPTFPGGSLCPSNHVPTTAFTEDFDSGFGVFVEDPGPGSGANDLTISTNGDTPSAGTGPETTASCTGGNPSSNVGEFVFLEASFTLANETHCMSTNVDLTGLTAPLNLSFWYYMFGDNIGELAVNIDGNNEFSVTGQQQTENGQDWIQGIVDLSAYAGTTIALQVCMSEGNGSVSTFEGDTAIDQIQIVTGCEDPTSLGLIPFPIQNQAGQVIIIPVDL